jgi:hypothetical protein
MAVQKTNIPLLQNHSSSDGFVEYKNQPAVLTFGSEASKWLVSLCEQRYR